MDDCRLCGELERKLNTMYETENFFVVPGLGQLTDGYLLICSKDHNIRNIASIRDMSEFVEVQRRTRNVLTFHYGLPVFFEHGSHGNNANSGCCIDHSHLHALSADISMNEFLDKHFESIQLDSLGDLQGVKPPYLYFETATGKRYACQVDTVPRQYLRQIAACQLGKPDKWDWRKHPAETEFQSTVRKLKGEFDKKYVFFGHAMDGLSQIEISEKEQRFARFVEEHGSHVVSMRLRQLVRYDDAVERDKMVEKDILLARSADIVFLDMSIPNRNYVGCIHELVEARNSGIPVIVYTGFSGNEKRNHLLYLSKSVFTSQTEAMEELKRRLA